MPVKVEIHSEAEQNLSTANGTPIAPMTDLNIQNITHPKAILLDDSTLDDLLFNFDPVKVFEDNLQ